MAFKYSNEYKLYEKQSALDNKYYKQQQDQLNKWNMESAKKQMDFQMNMSNTAHQREVQDLMKAGLNPVLSANNGASTSSGAYATIDSSPMSAASQSRIANRQIAKDLQMNRQNMANAYKIARYQAQMQFAAQKYATDMSYQLGMAGLVNQMEIAGLPYKDGNINQTTKYQVDSDPKHYLTNMITSLGQDLLGTNSAASTGSALAALILGRKKDKGINIKDAALSLPKGLSAAAAKYVTNKFYKELYSKNYNITKKDRLASYHEFAKGNWSYDSEKWKRDMGYRSEKNGIK